MFVYHLFLPVFYVCMYVYILSYFVNKLEIWWLYLSPIEKKKEKMTMHYKFNSFIHMTLLNNYMSMYHRQRDTIVARW